MYIFTPKGQNIWFEKQEGQKAARIRETRYSAGKISTNCFYFTPVCICFVF